MESGKFKEKIHIMEFDILSPKVFFETFGYRLATYLPTFYELQLGGVFSLSAWLIIHQIVGLAGLDWL